MGVILKALNLFSGIGGNRYLWPEEWEVTAIEKDPKVAEAYKKIFPNDKVIIEDVIAWLNSPEGQLEVLEQNFIWASPPCVTHTGMPNKKLKFQRKVPDLTSLFGIQYFFDNIKWYNFEVSIPYVVENVRTWYTPPRKFAVALGRHKVWSNFKIKAKKFRLHYKDDDVDFRKITGAQIRGYFKYPDIEWEKKDWIRKRQLYRNLVDPEIGLYILKQSQKPKNKTVEDFLVN